MAATGSTEDVFSASLAAPSDGEEVSNETRKEPYREEIVRVDLFTVVVTFAVLLTLISVGTVANVAVLVVLKYRKRVQATVRCRDAVLCNMSVVHLLICLVLAPIEFATVAESYVKHSLPAFVCLARDCGFHLLIGALVTVVVLLALCQARRPSAGKTPSRWAAEAFPVLQFAVPWIVGACAAATSVSTRLFTSLGFEVCRKSIAFWERVRGEGADLWQLDLVLGPVYFLALCGALWWLVVVVVVRRRRRSFEENEKKPEGECLPSAKDSRKMKPIKDGGDGGHLVNRTSGLEDPSHSKSSIPGGKRNSQITAGDNQKPPDLQENEEAEETDDIFDLKTRTEFENKTRSSGRRHTVANIGLPDLEDLRSASSPFGRVDGSGGGGRHHRSQTRHPSSSSKKTPDYHYVRKWSVDITALANQLENPKAHSDTSPFKERGDEGNGYEEALKGLQAPSNACVVASCEYIGPPPGKSEASPGAVGGGAPEEPGKRRPSSRNGNDGGGGGGGGKESAGRREPREKSVRSDIEEKVIATKDESPPPPRQEIDLPPPNFAGDKEPSIGCAEEREEAPTAAAVKPDPSRDAERGHARDTAKLARELTTLTKSIVPVTASLLLASPCFVLFVWFSVSPVHDLHLGYNLSVVSEMIVMLQAALNPVLLFWVDRRLGRRARRLLAEASRLRCVCYCNVSRQGSCLRPEKASVASRQRTADEKAPLKT